MTLDELVAEWPAWEILMSSGAYIAVRRPSPTSWEIHVAESAEELDSKLERAVAGEG